MGAEFEVHGKNGVRVIGSSRKIPPHASLKPEKVYRKNILYGEILI